MTPDELVAIQQRDDKTFIPGADSSHVAQALRDRRALLEYVGVLQGHLGKAFALYLDALIDMRLDDGESVLKVLFELHPEMRTRLMKVLER